MLGVAVALSAAGAPAFAQTFPAKPIFMVVPYAAGGTTDAVARRLAQGMATALGNPVVVDNKPGGGSSIAAGFVARASKDGYTILLATTSAWAVNPHVFQDLPYKVEDFAAVSLVSRQPMVITASTARGHGSMTEFIKYAKQGNATYGHTGVGTIGHIVGEWVSRDLGVKMVDVPYKSAPLANLDLIAGRIDAQIETTVSAIPMQQSGKAKALAIMADTRSPMLPDVPTFKELGYPDLVADVSFGVLAPAGTPDAVLNTLHKAIAAVVLSQEFSGKAASTGEVAEASASPRDFQDFVRAEYDHWGRIIKPMNLKMN